MINTIKSSMAGKFIFDLFDDIEEIKKDLQDDEDKEFLLDPDEMEEDYLYF